MYTHPSSVNDHVIHGSESYFCEEPYGILVLRHVAGHHVVYIYIYIRGLLQGTISNTSLCNEHSSESISCIFL